MHFSVLSSFMTRFVTRLIRRVPLVEQELLTFSEHLSSPPVFSGVHVTRSLVLYVMFCRSLFVLLSFFLLVIVLSVFLRFTYYDYPVAVFKLFLRDLILITKKLKQSWSIFSLSKLTLQRYISLCYIALHYY